MKPYLPSNGTEGEIFNEKFCYRCERGREDARGPCPIWGKAMCGDQPKEWVQDDDGPRCTEFRQVGVAKLVCSRCGASSESVRTRDLLSPGCVYGLPHTWRRE